MTKRFLDELVEISLDGNKLNDKIILRISEQLKRKELKAYIRKLRTALLKKTVTVVTPKKLSSVSESEFEKAFPDKIVRFQANPDTLLGVKVIKGDEVYDSTLKGEFDQITGYIKE